MIISQFDYQMYQDEISELRAEMAQLLISMEYHHQNCSPEEFDRWWRGEGNEQRYFACKGRIERIMNLLNAAQIEEADYPRMRRGGGGVRRYGAGEDG